MVTCDRCRDRIKPPREPVRGAFGYGVICPRCFGKLVEQLDQKNIPDAGRPQSLKRWTENDDA